MKSTDYEEVVQHYDENPVRLNNPADPIVAELLEGAGVSGIAVLDVGCGTGNYLAAQEAAYAGRPISWHGIEPSSGMLERARTKLHATELRQGQAEALPYPDGHFDYVVSTFAFHHFADKPRALDEIARVLMPGGVLHIANVAPEYMPGWSLYAFFPESAFEDRHRFWPVDLLCFELEARGFEPHAHIDVERRHLPLNKVLTDAVRRDTSQLAILDEASWQRGLARLRAILAEDPDARVAEQFALLRLRATRSPEAKLVWRG